MACTVPHAPLNVLPLNFDRPPSLLQSNLYATSSTNLSYHPDVRNPQIHSTFEVGESSAHSIPNVQAFTSSSGIAYQQLEGLRQQIEAIGATLGATSNTSGLGFHTPVPMYYDNSVTSFPTLSSSYVTNTVAHSTGYFSEKKLNDNNYFSWSQSNGP